MQCEIESDAKKQERRVAAPEDADVPAPGLPACLVGKYPSFSRAQLIHELDVLTECEEIGIIHECADFAEV